MLTKRAMRGIRNGSGNRLLPVLVVVGNGIASLRFCEEAVSCGLLLRFRLIVIGGEPRPAYDRVRLSQYIKSRDAAALAFRDAGWYAEKGIELYLGDPVTRLDLEMREVKTAGGEAFHFDELVFATGSSAFVPPIAGADLAGVFVYRTLDDLDAIRMAAVGKERALVIGGGLLGLEAAQALSYLDVEATVVERAAFPMPRQLNAAAGGMVRDELGRLGIRFMGKSATKSIAMSPSGLAVAMEDGAEVETDLVIVSAGISPNSEIAQAAGIACGVRGGIVVDDQLAASVPHVHAVGECALHRGQIYGLAAPAGQMARHLARRLAGRKCKPFAIPDLSTRLKMLGIEVACIGDPLDRGEMIEFHGDGNYRMLLLGPKRTVRGALGIGRWAESPLVHGWHLNGRTLREKEIRNFIEEGVLDPVAAGASVITWSESRLVCNCMHVTKGTLCVAIAAGTCTPETLAAETGASTVCGTCKPLLAELCGAPVVPARTPGALALLVISALAVPLVLLAIFFDYPVAGSVAGFGYQLDKLWSEPLPKQITGYSLLAVSLLGLLLSLRKRFPAFRFGAFAKWRVFHSAFGLVSLGALFAHTGFRFGANLNAWLMAVFVGINLLGSATGIAAALESRGNAATAGIARQLRPGLLAAHYVLFWPLPVLVAWHITAAYLY